MIDEWVPAIEETLAEDRETWHKQRHTATRIHERLRDEYGAAVSLSTVTRKVAQLKREFALEREMGFPRPDMASGRMPGGFRPGRRALAGFDGADASFRVGLPVFEHLPVPADARRERGAHVPGAREPVRAAGRRDPQVVYDNAAGVGRRRFDGIRLTRLFQAFRAHYGFEYAFCNPYSGHEKGAVEARVGAVRRKLFVPVPSVWSIEGFNRRLPDRCLELGAKEHYRKGGGETDLFAEDRKALLPLPARPFDVVTWKRAKTDKYGNVVLEGRHRYAAGLEHAGREMIVGLRALEGRDP